MNTATFVTFILGTCFYLSTAAPRQTEVYNQVAKAADFNNPDPCLLCNLLVQHISKSVARISCYDCWDNPYCIETEENQEACKKAVLANLMLQAEVATDAQFPSSAHAQRGRRRRDSSEDFLSSSCNNPCATCGLQKAATQRG